MFFVIFTYKNLILHLLIWNIQLVFNHTGSYLADTDDTNTVWNAIDGPTNRDIRPCKDYLSMCRSKHITCKIPYHAEVSNAPYSDEHYREKGSFLCHDRKVNL